MAKSGNVKDKTWGDINPSKEHMFGFRGTGTQEPGGSSQEGTGAKRGIEPKTGNKHGFYSDNEKRGREGSDKPGANIDYAGTASPGCSGPTKSGGDKKWAEGGSTHMWGNRGSRRMPEGQSGPNG